MCLLTLDSHSNRQFAAKNVLCFWHANFGSETYIRTSFWAICTEVWRVGIKSQAKYGHNVKTNFTLIIQTFINQSSLRNFVPIT